VTDAPGDRPLAAAGPAMQRLGWKSSPNVEVIRAAWAGSPRPRAARRPARSARGHPLHAHCTPAYPIPQADEAPLPQARREPRRAMGRDCTGAVCRGRGRTQGAHPRVGGARILAQPLVRSGRDLLGRRRYRRSGCRCCIRVARWPNRWVYRAGRWSHVSGCGGRIPSHPGL
jgi:hypothetical protein